MRFKLNVVSLMPDSAAAREADSFCYDEAGHPHQVLTVHMASPGAGVTATRRVQSADPDAAGNVNTPTGTLRQHRQQKRRAMDWVDSLAYPQSVARTLH